MNISLQPFITLLKYIKCCRSQHLNEAFDVGYVVFLSSKYVNQLKTRSKRMTSMSPHHSQRDKTFTQALISGGVPAAPGPEPRPVGRRCRSAPASRSAVPPWARNHVGGFELTYQIPHTLPGGRRRESSGWALNQWTDKSYMRTHTHLTSYACIFMQAVKTLLPRLPLSHQATCWGWSGSMWTLVVAQQQPKTRIKSQQVSLKGGAVRVSLRHHE